MVIYSLLSKLDSGIVVCKDLEFARHQGLVVQSFGANIEHLCLVQRRIIPVLHGSPCKVQPEIGCKCQQGRKGFAWMLAKPPMSLL